MPEQDVLQRPEQRILEHDEWINEAEEKFGNNPFAWRFVCPECGTVQTAADLIEQRIPEVFALNTAMRSCVGRFCDERVGCSYHASPLDAPVLVHPDENLTDVSTPPFRSSMPTPMMEFAREDQPKNLIRRRLFGMEMDDIACSQIGGCSADGYTISLMSTSLEVVLHPSSLGHPCSIVDVSLPTHWRLVGLRPLNKSGDPEILGLVNFKEVFTR